MPNKAIQNAKRLRGGALGQSSRFYNIYGQQVKASNPNGFKGGQGWTTHNPSIGSMLSNGIMKQNKNAGGNNVCQPGPGPTSVDPGPTSVAVGANGSFTVGYSPPPGTELYGFASGFHAFGAFVPSIINGYAIDGFFVATSGVRAGSAVLFTTSTSPPETMFSSISFVNSEGNVRTYYQGAHDGHEAAQFSAGEWVWDAAASGFSVAEEQTYWEGAKGKTLQVYIDNPTPSLTGSDSCEDCSSKKNICRGPSGACPCRSKVAKRVIFLEQLRWLNWK